MTIVGGLDVHRAQITFDYLDTDTGEVTRGQIQPATRNVLRTWFGRFAGLDVRVWSSDGKRAAGHPARQGSPVLRWALFEAARSAARTGSPDHDYYAAIANRLGGKRPALSVARKLIRRRYHTLRELGEEAWSTTGTTLQEAA